jgi:hypothetical protein
MTSAIRRRSPDSHAPAFSAIRLQIRDLVLRGFEKRDASRIAAAFERSLEDRLHDGAASAILRLPMQSPSLRLAPVFLRRSSSPAAIGEQLAGSLLAFESDARRRGGLG